VFHARVEVDVKTYKEEVTGKTGKTGKNKNTSKVNFRFELEAVAAIAAEEDKDLCRPTDEDITRELFVEGNDETDDFYAAIDCDAIDLGCIVSSI
jgi:hypothetical protein